jgi:hypothetical protein
MSEFFDKNDRETNNGPHRSHPAPPRRLRAVKPPKPILTMRPLPKQLNEKTHYVTETLRSLQKARIYLDGGQAAVGAGQSEERGRMFADKLQQKRILKFKERLRKRAKPEAVPPPVRRHSPQAVTESPAAAPQEAIEQSPRDTQKQGPVRPPRSQKSINANHNTIQNGNQNGNHQNRNQNGGHQNQNQNRRAPTGGEKKLVGGEKKPYVVYHGTNAQKYQNELKQKHHSLHKQKQRQEAIDRNAVFFACFMVIVIVFIAMAYLSYKSLGVSPI